MSSFSVFNFVIFGYILKALKIMELGCRNIGNCFPKFQGDDTEANFNYFYH